MSEPTKLEAQMAALFVRLALDDFTTDEIERFFGAISEMGWDLVPPIHHMQCKNCSQWFDRRDFDQVIAHEHQGLHEATGIVGELVPDSPDGADGGR